MDVSVSSTITSLLRSLLPSIMSDRNSEVPLYSFITETNQYIHTCLAIAAVVTDAALFYCLRSHPVKDTFSHDHIIGATFEYVVPISVGTASLSELSYRTSILNLTLNNNNTNFTTATNTPSHRRPGATAVPARDKPR